MATTGEVSVNLNNFGTSINGATTLADLVIGGVRQQGDLIGLAIGLSLAIGLLFALIMLVIGIIPKVIGKVRGIRSA